MGVVAEYERELTKARQAEGIAKAKAEGCFKGGVVRFDPEIIMNLYAQKVGTMKIARQLNCSRQTVWRVLGANKIGLTSQADTVSST